jgi:hypothetical protein
VYRRPRGSTVPGVNHPSSDPLSVYRTYNRTGHFLCAVAATISITRRAMALHRDFARGREPLVMFLNKNHQSWTVRGRHVQKFMERCCILAHPDPAHHLRRHIKCLMAHCLRVTAAVALFNSGEKEEMIAFRLRWNSDAVRVYLRDCYKSIGTLTSRALQGAFSDIPPRLGVASHQCSSSHNFTTLRTDTCEGYR